MRKFNLFIKRMFDAIVSFCAIAFCIIFPIFIVIPVVIRLTSKGPALFKQVRVGKDKKTYVMYKFRTMVTEQYDKNGDEIMSENRITKFGRFLRKTSLDELPQLFNVLNGTMSFVGPRPMLEYQAPRCEGDENLRFCMKPGITGLAQAKGRNNLGWPERIKYDIEYVNKFSFWLDIKILFGTVFVVLKREGTDVKSEYRGVDRFSKHYIAAEQTEKQNEELVKSRD